MTFRSRWIARAAAAIAGLACASGAAAGDLIEVVPGFPDYIQVNGTNACDDIVLFTLCDGSIGVVRFTGWTFCAGVIDAASAAAMPVVVVAGAGHDSIDSTQVTNLATVEVDAGDGDDAIYGGAACDFVFAGAGDDTVMTAAGDDFIFAGPGSRDRLFGGAGNDSLTDEDGCFACHGGEGDDSISILFSPAWDNDALPLNTRSFQGRLTGGGGNDMVLIGNPGSPILFGVNGDDSTLSLSAGIDLIELYGDTAAGSSFLNFEFEIYGPFSSYP